LLLSGEKSDTLGQKFGGVGMEEEEENAELYEMKELD